MQSRNQENSAKIGEGNGVLQNLKKGDGRQCKEGRHKIWGELRTLCQLCICVFKYLLIFSCQ